MMAELPVDNIILVGAALLIIGILVVGFSERLRVPAALLALGVGMVAGSDGLGLVDLADTAMVRDLSVLALVVILFEGGLTTKPSALREAGPPGLLLSSVGVLVTALLTGVGVELVFSLGWRTSLLLGAVVSSTDAAVVFDLVRRAPLPRRLASILEVESGANDPFAIVLTVALIATFEPGGTADISDWILFGAWQLVGGLLVGIAIGFISRWILNLRLRSEGLYPLVAAGLAGLSYGIATTVEASGFLAVYVCGLVIGATVPRRRRSIRSFHSSLSNGANLALFLLLGLLVFPSDLVDVALPALVVTATLVLVARPVAVLLSLVPFRLGWGERLVLSWTGLRGAVPIVLATFPATAGVEGGQVIFNVVFFVVLTSTLLQGTTIVPLVRRVGLEAPGPAWQSVAEALPLDVPEIDLAELVVSPDLAIAHTSLADHPPRAGVLVIAILRGGEAILPTGSTVILPGDILVLSLDESLVSLTDVTAWARGEVKSDPPETPEIPAEEDLDD
ncbi:MAG TPA: potassium/proton antiporter [Acidimicrobiia bacterium]|nr:potassium/proton antiporter [Acidimicrobiia bacterium]